MLYSAFLKKLNQAIGADRLAQWCWCGKFRAFAKQGNLLEQTDVDFGHARCREVFLVRVKPDTLQTLMPQTAEVSINLGLLCLTSLVAIV